MEFSQVEPQPNIVKKNPMTRESVKLYKIERKPNKSSLLSMTKKSSWEGGLEIVLLPVTQKQNDLNSIPVDCGLRRNECMNEWWSTALFMSK